MSENFEADKHDGRSHHQVNSAELPFLVTHWLSQYEESNLTCVEDQRRKEALQNIRRAASELASSFSALGVFGTKNRSTVRTGLKIGKPVSENSTFADLNRQCSRLPSNQLELLVNSAISSSISANELGLQQSSPNLVQAADELLLKQKRTPKNGRTLQDAIVLDQRNANNSIVPVAPSYFHRPALLNFSMNEGNDFNPVKRSELDITKMTDSNYEHLRTKFSHAMRKYLDVREVYNKQSIEITSIKRSLSQQQNSLKMINETKSRAQRDNNIGKESLLAMARKISEKEFNCSRISAHLHQKLKEVERSYSISSLEIKNSKENMTSLFSRCKTYEAGCHDPFYKPSSGRSVLKTIFSRQIRKTPRVGFGFGSNPLPRNPADGSISKLQKGLFVDRLSHAATINMHLTYPVYCLSFDRSGRYFITGADDYLVKVFCRSEALPTGKCSRRVKQDFRGHMRGAVLVCTLRGHAGVINDIDVSSDNCLLATASEDGDCRVWNLKNGGPIAILRGHVGGANMVSWSVLTPYRLVTTGHDGFARIWDVREAAMKRCGGAVGRRPEYCMNRSASKAKSETSKMVLPNIPERAGEISNSRESTTRNGAPPLPPIPPNANGRQDSDQSNEEIVPGQFVANDTIDEGVKLVSKLQHGAINESQRGTRSRAPVKVICVARCPFGGHFATGADDGICRVWADMDDSDVESIDHKFNGCFFQSFGVSENKQRVSKPRTLSPKQPLLTLTGHLSSITDLQYSYAGDRILTASQKDGVVRIWAWETDPIYTIQNELKKVVICLTNPNTKKASTCRSKRRENNNSSCGKDPKISCDVAAWTHDDSKIVTSQCQLAKQNSSTIQPGSQYLFLWDSRTGDCLIGISNAHTMQCPVIITHPINASLVCSAGADGNVKVWDLEKGICTFSHKNIMEYGALGENERGKPSGYLDGAFSPDGSSMLLTDDSGRISIFDSAILPRSMVKESSTSNVVFHNVPCPDWMKEQYRANDYYDLVYNTNGYCIERGSAKPPHLAPRGVRCTHSGAPFPDFVTEAFTKLCGPSPLPEHEVRWQRDYTRCRARRVEESRKGFHSFLLQRKLIQGGFNAETTILVKETGQILKIDGNAEDSIELSVPRSRTTSIRQDRLPNESRLNESRLNESRLSENRLNESRIGGTSSSGRQLSSNYRWSDYNDLVEETNDGDAADSDDEDFQLPVQNSHAPVESDSDDSMDMELESEDSPSRNSSRRRENSSRRRENSSRRQERGHRTSSYRTTSRQEDSESEVLPSRSSSRLNDRQRNRYIEQDSDEDMEFLSTNNTPSGPYVADYSVHYFRLPNKSWIAREWLRRAESNSSFEGRKNYTPQLGDSVVYIPRAHIATIRQFPGLTPPWQNWPPEADWPVVRCCIRAIRYRFPFMDYYGARNISEKCRSIVAILTLEITGLPELSTDREFCWPKPSFVVPSKSHVFELNVFENSSKPEFIFPACLYTWRLSCLEDAIRNHRKRVGSVKGLKITSFYQDDNDDSEDLAFVPYHGTLDDDSQVDLDYHAKHLCNIGYGAIAVKWSEGSNSVDTLNPWEVNVETPQHSMDRPLLSREDKDCIHKALRNLKRSEVVKNWFTLPVNEERYTDYIQRVEISMDLTVVETRLQSDYYATRQSIVADVQLIRNNCFKYNGDNDDLSIAIKTACKEFELALLTEDDLRFSQRIEEKTDGRTAETNSSRVGENMSGTSTQLRSRRAAGLSSSTPSMSHRSSLENLPIPVAAIGVRYKSNQGGPNIPRQEDNEQRSNLQGDQSNHTGRVTRSNANFATSNKSSQDSIRRNEDQDIVSLKVARSHSRPSILDQVGILGPVDSQNTSKVDERTDGSSQTQLKKIRGAPKTARKTLFQPNRNEGTTKSDVGASEISDIEYGTESKTRSQYFAKGMNQSAAVTSIVAREGSSINIESSNTSQNEGENGVSPQRMRLRSCDGFNEIHTSRSIAAEGASYGVATRNSSSQLLSQRNMASLRGNRFAAEQEIDGATNMNKFSLPPDQTLTTGFHFRTSPAKDSCRVSRSRSRQPCDQASNNKREIGGIATRSNSLQSSDQISMNHNERGSSVSDEVSFGATSTGQFHRSRDQDVAYLQDERSAIEEDNFKVSTRSRSPRAHNPVETASTQLLQSIPTEGNDKVSTRRRSLRTPSEMDTVITNYLPATQENHGVATRGRLIQSQKQDNTSSHRRSETTKVKNERKGVNRNMSLLQNDNRNLENSTNRRSVRTTSRRASIENYPSEVESSVNNMESSESENESDEQSNEVNTGTALRRQIGDSERELHSRRSVRQCASYKELSSSDLEDDPYESDGSCNDLLNSDISDCSDTSRTKENGEYCSSESEDFDEESPKIGRRSTTASKSKRKGSASKNIVCSDASLTNESSSRKLEGGRVGLRKSSRKRQHYCKYDSSESEDSEEEIPESVRRFTNASKPTKKGSASVNTDCSDDIPTMKSSPRTPQGRRVGLRQSGRKRQNYGEDGSSESEDFESIPKIGRRSMSASKPRIKDSVSRKTATKATPQRKKEKDCQKPSKRPRVSNQTDDCKSNDTRPRRQRRGVLYGSWPEIKSNQIQNIGLLMLQILRSYDEQGIFETPVLEAFPDLEETYLQIISQPMDFCTVEENLGTYRSINNLRVDVALIFQNCITYNGISSEYGKLAKELLEKIKTIYTEACKEVDVMFL